MQDYRERTLASQPHHALGSTLLSNFATKLEN